MDSKNQTIRQILPDTREKAFDAITNKEISPRMNPSGIDRFSKL
jgi:hypothetical protein